MLLVVSGMCGVFAILAAVGPTLMPRIDEKIATTSSTLPESMMTESFVPLCVLISLGVGLAVAFTVYRLGNLKGFFVFGTLAAMGLIALVAAMTLDIQPLGETRLKHMTNTQSAFTLLVTHAIVLPAASFCGWYASVVLYKNTD